MAKVAELRAVAGKLASRRFATLIVVGLLILTKATESSPLNNQNTWAQRTSSATNSQSFYNRHYQPTVAPTTTEPRNSRRTNLPPHTPSATQNVNNIQPPSTTDFPLLTTESSVKREGTRTLHQTTLAPLIPSATNNATDLYNNQTSSTTVAPEQQTTEDGEIRDSESGPLKTEDLANQVPVVIAHLAHLVSASMKQLDSAFRHSLTSGAPSTSPLIEYSQSFRTTLLQVSQRLSDALRTGNSNADKIQMLTQSSTSNIDNVQRYSARYYLSNPSLLLDLISAPLKRLSESSKENDLLARQAVAGFETVANLTRSVIDTVAASRQVKENRSNHTVDRMMELESEISFQNKTIQELRNVARKHEETFYKYLDEQLNMWEMKRIEQPDNKCLTDFLSREKSIETDWRGLLKRSCNLSLSVPEKNNYITFRDANLNWRHFMNLTHLQEEKLSKKREEQQQLVLANEALKNEKLRLDKDISLLSESVDPLVALRKAIKKLTASWKKLSNVCQIIESDVSATIETLNSISRGVAHQVAASSNNELATKLKKTQEDMDEMGKMTGVYVSAYNTHLADLASRLEQMVTINDADPAKLEESLVNACKDASKKISSQTSAHI